MAQDETKKTEPIANLPESWKAHVDRRKAMRLMVDELFKEMESGNHYGVIPKTTHRTLLEPGVMMMLFRLPLKWEFKEEILEAKIEGEKYPFLTVDYMVTIQSLDGELLGWARGSASTGDQKYRGGTQWVTDKKIPDGVDKESLKKREQTSNFKDQEGRPTKYWVYEIPSDSNPYQHRNTIAAIAFKRTLKRALLMATASSDLFNAELDENGLQDEAIGKNKGYGNIEERRKVARDLLDKCITLQVIPTENKKSWLDNIDKDRPKELESRIKSLMGMAERAEKKAPAATSTTPENGKATETPSSKCNAMLATCVKHKYLTQAEESDWKAEIGKDKSDTDYANIGKRLRSIYDGAKCREMLAECNKLKAFDESSATGWKDTIDGAAAEKLPAILDSLTAYRDKAQLEAEEKKD
jgi:hypothetical protein